MGVKIREKGALCQGCISEKKGAQTESRRPLFFYFLLSLASLAAFLGASPPLASLAGLAFSAPTVLGAVVFFASGLVDLAALLSLAGAALAAGLAAGLAATVALALGLATGLAADLAAGLADALVADLAAALAAGFAAGLALVLPLQARWR